VGTQPTGVTGPDATAPLAPVAPTLLPPPKGSLPEAAASLSLRQQAWRYLLGPVPGEAVSAHRRADPEPEVAVSSRWSARYGRFVLAAVLGFVGSLFIVASAPVWYLAEPAWRLTVSFIPHPGSSVSSISTFIVGLVLMVLGWLVLIGRADRSPSTPRGRLIAVVLVGAVWCLPIMAGPPLLSRDAYSYSAQGEMASRGIDPTANGPEVLRYGWYVRQADPLWRGAPAPYGPVAIEAEKLVVEAAGHDAAGSVWGMRVVALLGMIMAGVGVALIAGHYKRSPALAVALGVANPLVLLHLLGGSHNDSLMLGFLALGFAAYLRDRKLLGVLLVAMASAVKLTAAPALIFMAWNWRDDPSLTLLRRIRQSAWVLAGAAAVVAALCAAVGVGFGWISALKSTGQSMSTYSLPTKFGFVASDALGFLGLHPAAGTVIAASRALGLLAAGLISFVLLVRSPRIGLVRAFAFSSVAIVMLGPVVWPWYLATGFALLAASGVGRWRPTYVVLLVSATALVWPAGISPLASIQHYQNGISPLVIAFVLGVCWAAQQLAARRRRDERSGSTDTTDVSGADPSGAAGAELTPAGITPA
jgi:alpha-1,6-mannosyltransferase